MYIITYTNCIIFITLVITVIDIITVIRFYFVFLLGLHVIIRLNKLQLQPTVFSIRVQDILCLYLFLLKNEPAVIPIRFKANPPSD
ncbi:hypothetical protein Hanom_Chr01g00078911 [Helianthus anomalus]